MLFMVPRINIDSSITYFGTKFMLLTATFRLAPTSLVHALNLARDVTRTSAE